MREVSPVRERNFRYMWCRGPATLATSPRAVSDIRTERRRPDWSVWPVEVPAWSGNFTCSSERSRFL